MSDADVYTHESSDELHQELVRLLLQLKGKAILSGYPSLIYKPLVQAGWKQFKLPYTVRSKGRTSKDNFSKKSPAEILKARFDRFTWEYIWVSPNIVSFVSQVAPSYGWRESDVDEVIKPQKAARKKKAKVVQS